MITTMIGDDMLNVNVGQLTECSYEQLANALYMKGEFDSISKVTDKTKWRECVMAEKLNQVVHPKISAGKGSLEEGSDSYDSLSGRYNEYKSKAIEDKEIRNLCENVRNEKTGLRYAPLTVSGVYNGAYTSEAIDKYTKIDHYFGVFHKEICVLIIKVDTVYVVETLRSGLSKMKKSGTTNLNTVNVNLSDIHLYDIAYRNEGWWSKNSDVRESGLSGFLG